MHKTGRYQIASKPLWIIPVKKQYVTFGADSGPLGFQLIYRSVMARGNLAVVPGLILEVYDKQKQYHYFINGLEKVEGEPIIFSKSNTGNKKFERTSRRDFLKAQKRYLARYLRIYRIGNRN